MKLWRYGHAIECLGQRYRLEGALGSGGMADVCLAWDEYEAREVAIKVIKPDQLEQKTLDRFVKEAAQIARWQHTNILRIYSDLKLELLDPQQGSIVPYIVMEYAQGGDLHKRLTPGDPYPFGATLDLFAQLCSAVAYAHEHDIIHRDLKPLNILFRQLPGGSEQVVLGDFGLAVEANATHHTFAQGGTLLYMAPEQLMGHAQPASDIFALGVIFYQLCTGRMPFRRSLQELRLREPSAPPLNPSAIVPTLPEALDDVMLTALATDPEQRFSTASAFWEAIYTIVYSSYLRPSYSTLRQARSSVLGKHPALSTRTAPRRALQLAPEALNAFAQQVDIVADSQDLPPPTRNLALPTNRAGLQSGGQPEAQQSSIAGLHGSSYSQRLLHNSTHEEADIGSSELGQAQSLPYTGGIQRSAVYGRSDPLRSPVSRLPKMQAPAARSSGGSARLSQSPIVRGLVLLLVALLCVGGVWTALVYFAPTFSMSNALRNSVAVVDSTVVTITPDSKEIANSYVIQTITTTPDPGQRQIAARMLSSQPVSQAKIVNGTGYNQVPATMARGTLTFTNGAADVRTVAAGTTLQAANGAFIITDAAAVIPAANPGVSFGQTTVPAHVLAPGAKGNIPSGSISGTCCVATGVVNVSNNNAFTGGQDAKNYSFVQQSDVDAFANSVKMQLMQQANSTLTGQLKPGEQLAQEPNCPATVASSNTVGDRGQNVPATTVTVSVTCQAEAYDQNDMRSLVIKLLQQKAKADAGSGYTLQGNITLHAQVQQVNADGSVSMLVIGDGLWVYQFGGIQQQQLARLVAGRSVGAAKSLLLGQAGVRAVTIATGGGILPSDAGLIKVEVRDG